MVQAGSVVGFGAFGLAVVAERVEAGEAVVEAEVARQAGGVLWRVRASGPVQGAVPGAASRCCGGGQDAGEGFVAQAGLGLREHDDLRVNPTNDDAVGVVSVVAIVTGSGASGGSMTICWSPRGAKVPVNDLGIRKTPGGVVASV